MNNSNKIKVLYVFLICSLFACEKEFLEFVPKGRLIATTADEYQLLMNNNTFYNYNITSGWHLPMVMGDELAADGTYFNNTQINIRRAFRWEADILNPTSTDPSLTSLLQNIYVCNAIINEVMDVKGSEDLKKSVRAQALATRAWIYFQLINFYAKPYSAITAAQDAGFPIITEGDINQQSFDRSNVQAVYDFIINDLTAAIVDLPMENGVRTRMSKPAAEGILGKVLLFMGRNEEALLHFNAALTGISGLQNGPRLYDYNVELAPGGSFLPIGFNGPAGPLTNTNDYTESVVFKTFPNFNGGAYGNIGVLITDEVRDLFDAADLRLRFYTDVYPNGTTTPGNRLRKYVRFTRFGLELADLYLLNAECKARLNDLTGATLALQALREHRMPQDNAEVPTQVASNQEVLIRFIIEERIREYAGEGYRWFDMRRLSVDPLFSGAVFEHTVYEANNTETTIVMDQPNRLVMKIPQPIMDANPNMENNP